MEYASSPQQEVLDYPTNLTRPGVPKHQLETYRERLRQHKDRLFCADPAALIHFVDLKSLNDGKSMKTA